MRYLNKASSQRSNIEPELIEQNIPDLQQHKQTASDELLPSITEQADELSVEQVDVQSFVTELGDSSQLSQDKLWAMASVDAVTQLPNKQLFMDRLALELKRAKRDNHLFGLLLFSVDNFSQIQSAYGEKVANQVLKEISSKNQQILRSTDTVGYFSENQFGVLIAQQYDIQHLTRIAYKVYENQVKKIELSGHKVPVTISFGLSVYPEDGVESEVLIEHALYALNESSKQGGDRLTFYSQPLEEATGQRRILVQEIRKAIDSKQLFIRFQPVVDLVTGNVVKAEALIRWESPEKGEIKPQEFIDIAEDAGLIVEIGNFVFSETVSYLRKWKKVLPIDFQISINISPQQLRLSKELAKEWRTILLEKKVSGQSIVLEITEGSLLQDDRQIIQSIYELREADIRFCLDDFGTGYSSISYLKKLDIDYLKVDQSFVRDLNNNEEDQKIVEGILLMAKKMGMKSIAEGVETKEQLKYLREFGCEYGQGFYFARAMMPDEFIEWAKERFN
jgi:diguanylate cyclase (GGDEF)-like protein